jgi:2-desacetyl-2-hydroxyethyl bacteriochlorophyllide A dehydrogenase
MQAEMMIFERKQHVALIHQDLPEMQPDQIRAHAVCSLISTGTEGICFNRMFNEDSHWASWVKYPFRPGYSWIGVVNAVGEDVKHLSVGDRVAARRDHASEHILNESEVVKVPKEVDSDHAAWFALAKIAAMGARVAEYHLGDNAMIIGAGPIGQMSLRWARAAGCRNVIVVDPISKRLGAALDGGATYVIDKPVEGIESLVKEMLDGKLPDIVMDTTGHPAVFSEALKLTKDFGKMILLGDAGHPEKQCLTSDLLRKGLHIIGAHDVHNTPHWNTQTISDLFFSFIKQGRFNMQNLNWHVFKPSECAQAYQIISEHRADTMGILFDWSEH